MKKLFIYSAFVISVFGFTTSCEREEPAKHIEGNYTGVLDGKYDGDDTLKGGFPVYATATTRNKIKIEGDLFGSFEVLVTQQGINVDPVSTDEEIYQFLYQGDLKELSFRYYHNGDSTIYVGTKP
ncbi:MAG: hypothetical protein R2780_10805 [Crocinitomicaceae bacterium]|nr:hypothetical protein [Crocinitomicaceae bacterium]